MKTMETEDILSSIKEIMQKPLSQSAFDDLTSLEDHITDAVRLQINPEEEFEEDFRYREEIKKEGFVLNFLGHISANPSTKLKKNIFKELYVYPEQEINDFKNRRNKIYVNNFEFSGRRFLANLIASSKKEYNYLISKNNHLVKNRDIFILKGNRGIGKTFFINTLFSNHNDSLNKKKVIWVRIDVPQEISSNNENILDSLRLQIVKILLRYYNNHPDFLSITSDIKKIIKEKYQIERNRYIDCLNHAVNVLTNVYTNEKLTTDDFPRAISDEIIHYAHQKEFSFIYILDGMDKIDLIKEYDEKIIKIIKTLIKFDNQFGGCYLFCMRNESYEKMRKYIKEDKLYTNSKHNPIEYEIKPVTFDKIVEKRFLFLTKKVKDLSKLPKYQNWDLSDWPEQLNCFTNFLIERSNSKDFKHYFTFMEKMYGINNRVKCQILRLQYHEFLKTYSKTGFPIYILTETMCKSGFKYPPVFYEYDYLKNTLVPKSNYRIFDNIFLPSLFRFPYHFEFFKKFKIKDNTYLLLQFRLIQIMYRYFSIKKNTPISKDLIVEDVTDIFGYNKTIVNLALDELSEFGFIRLEGECINKRPKIDIVYNGSDGIICEIAYLNLASMRMYVNSTKYIRDGIPYFKAMTIDNLIDFSLNLDSDRNLLTDWKVTKILNCIAIFRLLKKLNLIEKQRRDFSHKFLSASYLFGFDEIILKTILIQFKGMLEKMTPHEKSNLFSRLNEHLDKW